jgi:ElaB/YqjD/DUF883 family membrane-anchored ribosome-binding protein
MSETGGSIGSAINYENMLEQLKEQAISKIGGDKLAKANALLTQLSQANMLLNHYDFYKKLAGALSDKAEGVSKSVNEKIGDAFKGGEDEGGVMETLTGLKQQAEEKIGQFTELSSKAQAFIKDPQQAITQAILDKTGITGENGQELTDFVGDQVNQLRAQAQGFTEFADSVQPIKDRLDELQTTRNSLEDAFNQRKGDLLEQQSNLEDRYSDFVNDIFDREGRLPTQDEIAPFQREADGLRQEAENTKQQFLQDDGDLVDEINSNQGRLEQIGKNIFSQVEDYNPAEGIFANLGNLDKPTLSALFAPEQLSRFEGISPYLGTFTDKSFIEKASQLVQSPVRELGADVAGNASKAFSENADRLVSGATQEATEQFNAIRSGITENFNNAKSQVEQQIDNATQQYQEGVEAVNQMRANASELLNQGQQAVNDARNAITQGVEEGASFAERGEQVASGIKSAGQAVAKTIGGEAGTAIEGGVEAVSSAIPVVGEVIDAGLIISQLVTGIVDIFKGKPHTQPQVVQATEQYGL